MLLNPIIFHSPRTLSEAADLYASLEDVKILAGGTFLLNSLKLLKKKGNKTPQNILSLRKVDELKGVTLADDRLIIKAMTIINDLAASPLLTDNFAVLKEVCKNISTNPIRNMATVGGNLTCRYTWTEFGAVMIALNADMHFVDAKGGEDVLSAEDFFKKSAKSDKIFTHVSVPRDPEIRVAYRRIKKSINVDVPLLAVCITTVKKQGRLTRTRVAVNNGVNFAQRDFALEDFLNQAEGGNGVAAAALDHLTAEIYDTRSDDYKKLIARRSLQSAIKELSEKSI